MTFKTRKIEMKCPFCGKGDITLIHTPVFLKFKSGPYGGSKAGITRTAEKDEIKEDKCPECGKSKKEIEEAIRTGTTKKQTHEERLRRLREAGLPTKIES